MTFTGQDVATIIHANDHEHPFRAHWINAETNIADGAYFAAYNFARRRHLIVQTGQVTEATHAGRRWIKHPH